MERKLVLLTILMSSMIISVGQDIIYKVTGSFKQSKIPLSSIIIENVTNGKTMSFTNLPDGDNYLINLSRNSFGGTVGVFDIKRNEHFTIEENLPGLLRLSYFEKEPSTNRLSIHNLNGQVLYFSESLMLKPGNSLNIQLPNTGLYIVKIESSNFQQTFKAIGKNGNGDMTITTSSETPDYYYEKDLKIADIESNEDFSFTVGDSLRIFAYSKQKEVYANPAMFQIKESRDVGFNFQEVIIAQRNELAYPDSTGIIVPLLFEDDTMYCRKINGEYIFQGDIILNENDIIKDSLKGAYLISIKSIFVGALWRDAKIYYRTDKHLENDERVKNAILHWNKNSPVKYIERKNELNYVNFLFSSGEDCRSTFGMRPGLLNAIFIPSWATYGEILHEMGHVAGMIHEHSRSDRNESIVLRKECYVMEDIDYKQYRSSFNIGPFDFESIMLYGTNYKDKDSPKPSCADMKKIDGSEIEVQRSYLSYWDIKTLEAMYGFDNTLKPKVDVLVEINDRSLKITGRIIEKGVGDITKRAIAYKRVGDPDYKYHYFNGGNEDFSIVLNDLKCGEYYFFAEATNTDGSSTSKTSLQYIPPDISINVSEIKDISAKLTINVNQDEFSCIDRIIYVMFRNLEEAKGKIKEDMVMTSAQLNFDNNPYSTEISWLKPETTYYLRVYLVPDFHDVGEYDNDIIEFTTKPTSAIGQNFGGGVIFYVDGTGQHGLIAAKTDQSESIEWYNGSFKYVGATDKSIGAGQANTSKIINALGNGNYAASVCDNLVLEGYDDWFLPSQYELDEMTKHFEVLGMQKSAKYWSSTDNGCTSGGIWGGCAYCRDSWGFTSFEGPSSKHSVRAIRKF